MSLPRLGVQLGASLTPEAFPRAAARSEEVGFRHLWLAEDYFALGGISSAAAALEAAPESVVGLGVVAAVARHPAVLAMEVAQLARANPGRFIAGIGHGAPAWVRQMGLSPRSPLTALEECVQATRALLEGETVTSDGTYFRFDRVRLQHPPEVAVPLVTGVHGERSLRLSGRIADGTLLGWFSSPAYVRWASDHIAAGGRDDHWIVTLAVTSIGPDGDAARARIRPFVEKNLAAMADSPQIGVTGAGVSVPSDRAGTPDDWLDAFAVAGDPDQCSAALQRLFDAGSDAVVLVTNPGGHFDPQASMRQIEFAGQELLPSWH